MTSKEDSKKLKDAFLTIKQEWLEDSNVKLTEWQKNIFESLEKDLEVLEIIKKVGILDLVFSEEPYCNLVITNRDVIGVDYDRNSPDIEMTWEDYKKVKEWLDGKD